MTSERFQQIASATKRHIPPHVWDTYPEESRAEMMAFDRMEGEMHRYEEFLADKKRQSQETMRVAKGRKR